MNPFVCRYLETFERINFLGEDVEDVLTSGRPHTPVSSFILPSSSGKFLFLDILIFRIKSH